MELIRGSILEEKAKTPLHCFIAKWLYDRITSVVPSRFLVHQYSPLTFGDSEPEPDISVVRGALADFLNQHPTTAELVIEVAVSSAALDRENASLYAEAGVKEYWIVLALERRVEVYRGPSGGTYQEKRSFGAAETIECSSVPGIRIRVADLFV